MPRMKILNSVEQEAFESPPILNSTDRKRCFDFPLAIEEIAASLRTSTNQLAFLLSFGYFKATKRFYPVQSFHQRDLTYVADRFGVAIAAVKFDDYDKRTMARHQTVILDFYGFRAFKPHGRSLLAAEIARLVNPHIKPKLIFSRAIKAEKLRDETAKVEAELLHTQTVCAVPCEVHANYTYRHFRVTKHVAASVNAST